MKGLSQCEGIYATYYAMPHCATFNEKAGGNWSALVSMEITGCVEGWSTSGKGAEEIKCCVCASHSVLMSPLQLMDHCTVQMTEQVQALITCNTAAHELF